MQEILYGDNKPLSESKKEGNFKEEEIITGHDQYNENESTPRDIEREPRMFTIK